MTDEFWKKKTPFEYTREEWEALCDHCGMCCLYKIEDTETGIIYTTYVACQFLDTRTCACTEYDSRGSVQPECIQLTPETIGTYTWLPETCAYRLVAQGRDLPGWHPLKTGDPQSTTLCQKSVAHFVLPWEEFCTLSPGEIDSLEDYIIFENHTITIIEEEKK
jgi:uncharacterized protein